MDSADRLALARGPMFRLIAAKAPLDHKPSSRLRVAETNSDSRVPIEIDDETLARRTEAAATSASCACHPALSVRREVTRAVVEAMTSRRMPSSMRRELRFS